MAQRISVTDDPGAYMPRLEAAIREQEGCALLREFWNV